MPKLDGTGPVGQGPRTGRGMGFCRGGMGRGRGCENCCGGGFGFRQFFSSKNQLSSLEDEEKALEEELAFIREEKAALKDQQK